MRGYSNESKDLFAFIHFNTEIGLKTYITPIGLFVLLAYCLLWCSETKRKIIKYIERRQAFVHALFVLPKNKISFLIVVQLIHAESVNGAHFLKKKKRGKKDTFDFY